MPEIGESKFIPETPEELAPLFEAYLSAWAELEAARAMEPSAAKIDAEEAAYAKLHPFEHDLKDGQLRGLGEKTLELVCGARREITEEDAQVPERRVLILGSKKRGKIKIYPARVMRYDEALEHSATAQQQGVQETLASPGSHMRSAADDKKPFTPEMVPDAVKTAFLGMYQGWRDRLKAVPRHSGSKVALLLLSAGAGFEQDKVNFLGIQHHKPTGQIVVPKPGARFFLYDLPKQTPELPSIDTGERAFQVIEGGGQTITEAEYQVRLVAELNKGADADLSKLFRDVGLERPPLRSGQNDKNDKDDLAPLRGLVAIIRVADELGLGEKKSAKDSEREPERNEDDETE